MSIRHVLAVVPVSNLAISQVWYERLFGSAATNVPMDTLAEWRVTETGFVQVTVDVERAGSGSINFAVDDLEDHMAGLRARGLTPGETINANKGVQLCPIDDPDGNTITFIGNFRETY